MITGFAPRLYQETILSTATQKNTLVVLPTGTGKTGIAFMLAAHRLKQHPQSKIVFLAPTKPLVEQHLHTFKEHLQLPEERFAAFTGELPPKKRAELWKTAQIIFSTPQGLENDIINERISFKEVSLLIFDEAHRATGNYSYAFLAKQYVQKASFPRILALTASPGSEIAKIEEACKNLYVEDVEIRTDKDADMQPYLQETSTVHVKVELPQEFRDVKKALENCLNSRTKELKRLGANNASLQNKTDLLKYQRELQARMAAGERDFTSLRALSLLAELMKAQHALELLESQGLAQLNAYMQKLFDEASKTKVKAVKRLVADTNFKTAFAKTQELVSQGVEHPKFSKLKQIITHEINNNKKAKIILFTQYRDTATRIKKELENTHGIFAEIFVGQAKKGMTGMSQKQQVELIQQFKDGLHNVLICTSVAEEGLDIPAVDLVVFYEPIPSAIRTIQRRGRTGRQKKGKVVVLIAQGTRDEGYRWSAFHKEKRMHKFLNELKTRLHKKLANQTTLTPSFNEHQPRIFADYREKGTGVIKELINQGANIRLDMLKTADYILSPRVGVEFKTAEDFVQSIIDGRLLDQLKQLRKDFARPILLIEGPQKLYSVRNVHPNAIRGMLATIAVSFGIPILYAKNAQETAAQLITIAKREQELKRDEWTPHAEKRVTSVKEQQEYVISSLPGVGPQLAKNLLKHFKNVKNTINASEEELKKVHGVGDKIAKSIKDVSDSFYHDNA